MPSTKSLAWGHEIYLILVDLSLVIITISILCLRDLRLGAGKIFSKKIYIYCTLITPKLFPVLVTHFAL